MKGAKCIVYNKYVDKKSKFLFMKSKLKKDCITKEQKQLLDWFKLNGAESLGELYMGVLFIMEQKEIPGQITFISHAIREIGNRLPAVFNIGTSSRIQYVNELDNIAKYWKNLNPQSTRETTVVSNDGPKRVEISLALYNKISKLIEKKIKL